MKQIEFNKNIICFDDYKIEENHSLRDFLESDFLKETIDSFKEKIIVVLGWDGTMLRAIKENYEKNMPFLWINFWHKWFLLNSRDSIKQNTSFLERQYPLLEIELETNWEIKKAIAVNEIDIRSGNWKMISLDISLTKKQSINIEWDWILISTPAWSTGYNSSLGWPIIPHTLNAFVMTPKAPWKPKLQAPVLMRDDEIIEIKNVWRQNIAEIYFDSVEFFKSNEFNLKVQKYKDNIRLLIWKDYLDTWDNKVLSEQGFLEK